MTSRYLNACVYVFLPVYYFLFFIYTAQWCFYISFPIFPAYMPPCHLWTGKTTDGFRFTHSPSCVYSGRFVPMSRWENTRTRFVSPGRFLILYPLLTLKCHEYTYICVLLSYVCDVVSPAPVPMGSASERVSVFSSDQSRSGRPRAKP